jgi:hypothetical protein
VIGIVGADKKIAEVVIIRSDNNLGFNGFFAKMKMIEVMKSQLSYRNGP